MLPTIKLAIGIALVTVVASHGGAADQVRQPGIAASTEICKTPAEASQLSGVALFTSGSARLLLHTTGDVSSNVGSLSAYAVDVFDGKVGAPLWNARALPADDRAIVTWNSDGMPAALRWNALDDRRRAELRHDAAALESLRGNASDEGLHAQATSAADPTDRFGAIVHSTPLLVGPPAYGYPDDLERAPYSAFSKQHAQRPAHIYVGSGDAMLHAFDARTGIESLAVVPGAMFPRIGAASGSSGGDRAIVDGTPSVGDAFIGGRWRTVLLSGLGRGGRSIIALDITDPASFRSAESDPSRVLLWEFVDEELGETHSQPVVARLHNGSWVALFGNGYAPGGRPILFVVDLATGRLVRKLHAGSRTADGSGVIDGLSTPAAVDVNGDRIVELVYAGDLRGNVWKFDLSAADSAKWSTAFEGAPLYRALGVDGQPQPVTLRPEVVRGPSGKDLLVVFAAGHTPDLASSPGASAAPATLYAVVDANETVRGREVLAARQIASAPAPQPGSNSALIRSMVVSPDETRDGWYLDFTSADGEHDAEQVLTAPSIRDGQITVLTGRFRKSGCNETGTLWVNTLDIFAVRPPRPTPMFDVNRDGRIDMNDLPRIDGPPPRIAGHAVAVAAAPGRPPRSMAALERHAGDHDCIRLLYVPRISAAGLAPIAQSCRGPRGRQSWRQLR